MKSKISLFIILSGIIFSMIGFLLMKTNTIATTKLFEVVYNLTTFYAFVTLLSISTFIKEKFNNIFYILIGIFLVLIVYNLINQYKYFDYKQSKIIVYVLLGILPYVYIKFTTKKKEKSTFDTIKIAFVTLIYVSGFLGILNFLPEYFGAIIRVLFLILVIIKLYGKFSAKDIATIV